jgi:YggT family protein
MYTLISAINILFTLFNFLIIVRVLFSWIRVNPYNPLVRLLFQITEPVLAPFRRLIPPAAGLDFSPLVAYFALEVLRRLLISILLRIS